MKSAIILLVTLLLLCPAKAQDSTKPAAPRGKHYTARIYTLDSLAKKGILTNVGENGITLADQKGRKWNYTTLTPEQINFMYVRRKGNVGLGALIGGVAGIAIGAVIGYSTKDESPCQPCYFDPIPTKEAGAFVGGFIGSIGGVGLGLIIGSQIKKKFIIRGKRENYRAHYNDLVERAMTQ